MSLCLLTRNKYSTLDDISPAQRSGEPPEIMPRTVSIIPGRCQAKASQWTPRILELQGLKDKLFRGGSKDVPTQSCQWNLPGFHCITFKRSNKAGARPRRLLFTCECFKIGITRPRPAPLNLSIHAKGLCLDVRCNVCSIPITHL